MYTTIYLPFICCWLFGLFPPLTILNGATINFCVLILAQVPVSNSSKYIPRNGTSVPYDNSMLNFLQGSSSPLLAFTSCLFITGVAAHRVFMQWVPIAQQTDKPRLSSLVLSLVQFTVSMENLITNQVTERIIGTWPARNEVR